jgi:hypothetical protein
MRLKFLTVHALYFTVDSPWPCRNRCICACGSSRKQSLSAPSGLSSMNELYSAWYHAADLMTKRQATRYPNFKQKKFTILGTTLESPTAAQKVCPLTLIE